MQNTCKSVQSGEKQYYELPLTLNVTMQGKAKLRGLLYENFKVKEFNDPNELKLVDLEPDPDQLEGEGRFKVNVKTK